MLLKRSSVYVFLCICLLSVLVVGTHFSFGNAARADYTLKEDSGGLVVISADGSIIESITDTNLAAIPEADRKRLQQGISVFSREELVSLIEDFLC